MPGASRDVTSSRHDGVTKQRNQRNVVSREAGHKRLCRVCGQEAAGIYFSALVCLPCKSFFLRCVNGKEPNVKCEKKNCKINAATRTICKFCRYKRCLAIGMTRKELPEKADTVNGQELCRVCGDVANGVHFGAVTCEGCKNFFRRSLTEEAVTCKKDGNCIVNLKTRKGCRGCRYRKCIAAGMSKEAKKPGRRNRPTEVFVCNSKVGASSRVVDSNDEMTSDSFTYTMEEGSRHHFDTDLMGQVYEEHDSCQYSTMDQSFHHDYHDLVPADYQGHDGFNLVDDIILPVSFQDEHLTETNDVFSWSDNSGLNFNSFDSLGNGFVNTLESLPAMEMSSAPNSNPDDSASSSLSSPSLSPSPSPGYVRTVSPVKDSLLTHETYYKFIPPVKDKAALTEDYSYNSQPCTQTYSNLQGKPEPREILLPVTYFNHNSNSYLNEQSVEGKVSHDDRYSFDRPVPFSEPVSPRNITSLEWRPQSACSLQDTSQVCSRSSSIDESEPYENALSLNDALNDVMEFLSQDFDTAAMNCDNVKATSAQAKSLSDEIKISYPFTLEGTDTSTDCINGTTEIKAMATVTTTTAQGNNIEVVARVDDNMFSLYKNFVSWLADNEDDTQKAVNPVA